MNHNQMLKALRCPKTGGELTYQAQSEQQPEGYFSSQANLLFPIVDGIPCFLIEEAIPQKASKSALTKDAM